MNQTLFISDLHLDPSCPQITQIFLKFLAEWAPNADALYILGDFFEVWVGDDNATTFNTSIKQALKQLTDKGVPVYFMPGNRDFLIGKRFAQDTGCKLLPDPTVIDLYGTPTLLMHGDSLCTDDVNHQRFRNFSQHPLTKKLFLMTPLWFRRYIARKLRQISSQRTQSMATSIMDVNADAVIAAIKKYHVTQLIHGHTHRPEIHTFNIDGSQYQRIVLGAWHDAGIALIQSNQNNAELIKIAL